MNPNKIDSYIQRLTQITEAEAFLFCNIPAFGTDEVFGTAFPFYVDGWEVDAQAGRPFSRLHVDDLGYHSMVISRVPMRDGGFSDSSAPDFAVSPPSSGLMQPKSPARRAFFVFSKASPASSTAQIAERISKQASRVPRVAD